MSDKQTKRFPVYVPEPLKRDIEQMSEETSISQSDLVVMSMYSLVGNYKKKGSFIFVDLLNPDHKK